MEILDAVSPLERVKLSRALATKLTALTAGATALERVRISREVAVILGQLGASVAAPEEVDVTFSLADADSSARSLAAYVDRGLSALPQALAYFEAETVYELAQSVGAAQVAHAANQTRTYPKPVSGAQLDAFEEMAARGVRVELDREGVLNRQEEVVAMMRERLTDDSEAHQAQAAVEQLNTSFEARSGDLWNRLQEERKALKAGTISDSTLADALEEQYVKEWAVYKAEFAKLSKQFDKAKASAKLRRAQRAIDLFAEDGGRVIKAVLDASPISQAEAESWASQQVIDKSALTKLSKLGYKKEDVYRDMAEFYRLSGGKASAVRISTDGGRRANAVGVTTRLDEKVINLGSHFNKTVLFHELAHHLENDPIAKAASNGFLLKRRESPTVYSLRSLTGNTGYARDEGAYKDSFMDEYIGKVYSNGITEVFSMGVQYLANPKDAAIFAAKDPEMFALITGYLSSELTPAMKAKLNMHGEAIDDLQDKRATKAVNYEGAVKALSETVPITKDDWWEQYQRENDYDARMFVRYNFNAKKPPVYIGSFGEYKVFEGLCKNMNTKRTANGHVVGFFGTGVGLADARALHGGLDFARAFIALCLKTGQTMSSVWYAYFLERSYRDSKEALIAAAKPAEGGGA